MNEYEYQQKVRKIKKRNRNQFLAVIGGIVALNLGTKIYLNHNPDISQIQRQNLTSIVLNASSFLTGIGSLFFTYKESGQFSILNDEYSHEKEEK